MTIANHSEFINRFDWVRQLPEFGETYRLRTLFNERGTIPFKVQELEKRAKEIDLEITALIETVWTSDEIQHAQLGRFA